MMSLHCFYYFNVFLKSVQCRDVSNGRRRNMLSFRKTLSVIDLSAKESCWRIRHPAKKKCKMSNVGNCVCLQFSWIRQYFVCPGVFSSGCDSGQCVLMLSSNQGVPVLAVNASAVFFCTAGADRPPAESLQPSHYITPAENHWK